jgi:hypothetical protein
MLLVGHQKFGLLGLDNVMHLMVDTLDVPQQVLMRLLDELFVGFPGRIYLALATFRRKVVGGRVRQVRLIRFWVGILD